MHQPNVGRHVTTEGQPDLLGDLDHVVPGLQGDSWMDLLKVVALFLVRAHEPLRGRGVGRRVPVDRRRSDVEIRSERFAALELIGERDLVLRAEHAPDRSHPVRDVEEEDVLYGFAWGVVARRYVRVHFGEPGCEVAPRAVDDRRSVPDHDVVRWADLGDHAVDYHDRVVREYGLSVHRDDVDVRKRDRTRRGILNASTVR